MQPAEAILMGEQRAVPSGPDDANSMHAAVADQREALQAQLRGTRAKLDALAFDLSAVDAELAGLATERKQHQLLANVCDSLTELAETGGAQLFWGDGAASDVGAEHIRRVQNAVDACGKRVSEIEQRRRAVIEQINEQQNCAGLVEDGLFEVQEEEERLQQEWIIEREISDLPARQTVMPWARGGEDDKRYRKSLASTLSLCLLFALILHLIDIPKRVLEEMTAEPHRLVRLMEERRKVVPPVQAREEPKPQPQKQVAEQKPQPAPSSKPDKQEPAKPADKGILAFRDKFSSLKESNVTPRLGRQARISSADDSVAHTERSMLSKLGPGSSGGINLAALSRDVGGGGNGVQTVQVAHVSSGIGGSGPASRPLSGDGPGLGRTDEEIQIVFDRYKAALYRLYNRELRKDPTLRGQVVLRLTIEPNGSVSFCQLQHTDMNAPDLAAQVVERVKTFDFGAKDVGAITIVYPIDFLPAA
jgi:outer membrane biosynthesis protein TonB